MTYPTSPLPVHAVAHIYPAELHHQSHQERNSAQSLLHLHHPWTCFSEQQQCESSLELDESLMPFPRPAEPLRPHVPSSQSRYVQKKTLKSCSRTVVCLCVCVSESDVTCHSNPDTPEPNGEGALKHRRSATAFMQNVRCPVK